MSRACRELKALDAWARAGMREPLSEALERHVERCPECTRLLSDLMRTPEFFPDPTEVPLDPRRAAAVRFAVVAEARARHGRRSEPMRDRRTWLMRLALAAAVVTALALLAGSAWLGWYEDEPEMRASVSLAPDAVGEPLRSGLDAVFVLRTGTAQFSVPRLSAGQRYRVWAAGDEVEVRGTEFEVTATERGLEFVRVRSGEVVVRVQGRVVAELRAGAVWSRPGEQQAASAKHQSVDTRTATSSPDQRGATDGPRGPHAAQLPAAHARGPQTTRTSAALEAHSTQLHRDAAFRRAWSQFKSGRYREAARSFDALSQAPGIDSGRRADLLYWSARAHQLSGEWNAARSRAQALMSANPKAWHAPNAALLVGESHLLQGNPVQARAALEQALSSDRPAVRQRARELLKRLDAAEE